MSSRQTTILDPLNPSTKPSLLPNLVYANFLNGQALVVEPNQATGSPFTLITTGKKTLVVMADITEGFAAAGSDTVSLDIDGTLIGGTTLSAGVAERENRTTIGFIQNLAPGTHTLNIKHSGTGTLAINNVITFEI